MTEIPLIYSFVLVYLASLCYVIASYYHLHLSNNWTFVLALSMALPIVLIEYCFSLPGNYALHQQHNFEPIQILIITIVFYFINLWLLNVFILKTKITSYLKEILAFVFIICAFMLTTVI